MTLIAVTFNCTDDWNAHLSLFDYGYNNYKIEEVIKEGIVQINNDYYEATPFIPFSLKYPVKKGEVYDVIVYLENNPKGKIIGKAYLLLNNIKVKSIDVYRYY